MYIRVDQEACYWVANGDTVTIAPLKENKDKVFILKGKGVQSFWEQLVEGIRYNSEAVSAQFDTIINSLKDYMLIQTLSKGRYKGLDPAGIKKLSLTAQKLTDLIPENVTLLTATCVQNTNATPSTVSNRCAMCPPC